MADDKAKPELSRKMDNTNTATGNMGQKQQEGKTEQLRKHCTQYSNKSGQTGSCTFYRVHSESCTTCTEILTIAP